MSLTKTPAEQIAQMKIHAGAVASYFAAAGASPESATAAALGYLDENADAIAEISAAGKALHSGAEPSPEARAAVADMQGFIKAQVGTLADINPALAQAFGAVIARMRA